MSMTLVRRLALSIHNLYKFEILKEREKENKQRKRKPKEENYKGHRFKVFKVATQKSNDKYKTFIPSVHSFVTVNLSPICLGTATGYP